MKKIKALMVAFVLAGMTVVSCSSDDSSGPPATIGGQWNQTKTVTKVGTAPAQTQNYNDDELGCTKDYVEFLGTNSGTVKKVIYFKNAQNVCQSDSGLTSNWSKNENTLTISSGEFEGVYTITRLSNTELIISGNFTGQNINITYHFRKASN